MRDVLTARGGPIGLIVFGLVAACLLIVPGGSPDIRQQQIVNAGCIALLGLGLWILLRVSACAGVLAIYAGVTALRGVSTMTLLPLLCAAGWLLLVTLSARKASDRALIYDALIVVTAINLAWQALQYFGIYLILEPRFAGDRTLPGLMSNADETFGLYAMCLPAFLRPRRWQLLIPVCLAGLVLASPLVYAKQYVISEHLGLYRATVWGETARMALVKPAFGWGFGEYARVMPLVTSSRYIDPDAQRVLWSAVRDKAALSAAARKLSGGDIAYFTGSRQHEQPFVQAHNEFVEWFFAGGIAGIVLLAGALVTTLVAGWYGRDRIPFLGLCASCACASFFFVWHIVPLVLITLVWAGLIYAQTPANEPHLVRS